MFTKRSLDGYYFKMRGFYVFHIPVKVPYTKLYASAEAAGVEMKQAFGPILESGRMFGFGWIGVEVDRPTKERKDVTHLSGEFESYDFKGPYKTIGKAYKTIMKARPKAKEYYSLYLDDPNKTRAEDCRTQIYFR